MSTTKSDKVEFWESTFQEVETLWGYEAADSAIQTCKFFSQHHMKEILIPGVGYGRNAGVFLDHGMHVTGIEISASAIKLSDQHKRKHFHIHHGSVAQMPFDDKLFDGIFCYALIHLLNKNERKQLIRNCFKQLKPKGYMVFVAISTKDRLYGKGKRLSENRFEISNGLKVYFYSPETAANEFNEFGLVEVSEIEEPIKHMKHEAPLECVMVMCEKR